MTVQTERDGPIATARGGEPARGREPGRGRYAERPAEIPKRGWKDVLTRTAVEMKADNIVLLAAGVAFFGLLAVVPALVAFVSVYGIAASPQDVSRHVGDILAAAPAEARDLIESQLRSIAAGDTSAAGVGALVGILISLWSASSGMKHSIAAVNAAYDEEETRGFLRLRGLSLVLTLGAITFTVVAILLIVVLPSAVAGESEAGQLAVKILRWPLLGAALLLALAVFYRYAPDRDDAQWRWVSPGAVVATVLWLLGSAAFSLYTANFGTYNETYGSLGAIVVVMLWLLLTAFVVMAGAELNAELERQTRVDTTEGQPRPLGARGAHAADTVGPTASEVKARRRARRADAHA